jgi:RNA polymerase sigma-70 factor (ECF subfamily)
MTQRKDLRGSLDALAPGIRRYARALSAGEPPSVADELLLEAFQPLRDIASSDCAGGETELRLRLYAAFTRMAEKKLRGAASTGPSLRHPVIVHGLADLQLEDREALLLVVLEGFSYDHAADILGVERETLVGRLVRARTRLAAFDNQPSAPSDGTKRTPALHLRVVK